MKSPLLLVLPLCLSLLNGCASTEPSSSLSGEETALTNKVNQYPNDTLALRELTQYQLEQFEKTPDFTLLSRLQGSLQKGLEIAPADRYFAYHYYRINLQLSLVEERFDEQKWQAFYTSHPFLATLDIAPPVYVQYLLKNLQGAEKVAVLQQSLHDNPFFTNAYLELARHYYQQDKFELASYLMLAARKHNEESVEVLSDLVHYKSSYLMEKMCFADISNSVPPVLELARTLTKMVPNEAFFQSQLADAFRLSEKYPLATFAGAKAAQLDNSYQDYLLELYLWDTRLDKVLSFAADEQNNNELIMLTKVYANIAAGNWAQAASLAKDYSQLADATPYGVIYGAYSYSISGNAAGRAELLKILEESIEMEDWQNNILAFARGDMAEEQLMSMADDRCKQTEALFVAALQHIEDNQIEKADSYWQRIIDLKVLNYFEFATARNRLKALKAAANP